MALQAGQEPAHGLGRYALQASPDLKLLPVQAFWMGLQGLEEPLVGFGRNGRRIHGWLHGEK